MIYVGGNNAANGTDIEFFEEKYDQLVTSIKKKNADSKIYMCTSCPRGDTDVGGVNEVITMLSRVHGARIVDTNFAFHDKACNVRAHFYKPRDNIHLSRSGVKRVLGTINEHINIVENYEKCVFGNPTYSRPISRPISGDHGQERTRNGPVYEGSTEPTYGRNIGRGRMNQHNQDGNKRYRQFGDMDEIDSRYRERCLKFGLTNHITGDCRHETQLQCFKV